MSVIIVSTLPYPYCVREAFLLRRISLAKRIIHRAEFKGKSHTLIDQLRTYRASKKLELNEWRSQFTLRILIEA